MAEESKEFLKKVEGLSKAYMSLGDPQFTRSGSVVLDALLGGGIPAGAFILWSSENGCGKSTGSLFVCSYYCSQGKKVLYLDYEGGVNHSQIDGCGLSSYLYNKDTNPEGIFYYYRVQTYKDAENILDSIMTDMSLVIIDSVTAILTEKVKGSSAEDVLPGQDARVQSVFLKKYKAEAIRNGVTWIMINQLRTHIRFMGATTEEEAGGKALKFYSDIRMSMKKTESLERNEDTANGIQKVPFGALCKIWTEKNRYARPKIPLNLAVIFGSGISNEYAYYDFLTMKGCIVKSGAWYTVKMNDFDCKLNGSQKVIDWIHENKQEILDFIKKNGGYKLINNDEDPGINLDDEAYDKDVLGEAFDVEESLEEE